MTATLRVARATAVASLAVALLFGVSSPAGAQAGGPVWYALDASQAGTRAEVMLDTAASGPSQTTFDLVIHGFWATPRTGPDGTPYTQIDVPGLQRLSILGAPQIPVFRSPIAVVTDAANVSLVSETAPQGAVSFSMHLWPQPVPAMEDTSGTPEVFTLDPAIYALSTPYPADPASAGPIRAALGPLASCTLECHPIRWTPSTDLLTIQPVTRYAFAHDAPLLAMDAITRDRNRDAAATFFNWSAVNSVVPVNVLRYQGEFLFVYPSAYATAIKPLAVQKSARGYNVTKITTESLGSVTCESVRNAIMSWYASTPSTYDHYCILVGDQNAIPFCPEPGGTDPLTDDLYGTADPNNLDRDVFVGRLPVTSDTDVANQAKKIIDYEDHPPGTLYYGDVLLVAHKPDYSNPDGDYEKQQEIVRTSSYAKTPTFFPYYGSDASHTNTGISARINTGMGITSYRGHGGSNDWWTWNVTGSCPGYYPTYTGECYTGTDVSALSNGALTTIVWSIACNNADLRDAACLGRAWMTRYPGGAVAHYGSTRPSSTQDNDTLEDSLFAAVWTYNITKLGHATTWAEDRSIHWDYGYAIPNAWSYCLFGDPEMDVRRQMPPPWEVVVPTVIALGAGQMDVQVHDAAGAPVVGALVSVWKPAAATPAAGTARDRAGRARTASAASAGDEVADNLYTGSDGAAQFTVNPQTTGALLCTIRDTVGNAVTDTVQVVSPGAVPPGGGGGPLVLIASPSVTHGRTRLLFGRALAAGASVRIYDLFGRPVATLEAPRGASQVVWSGTNARGEPVRSGLYFATLAGPERRVTRVIMVR